MTYERHIANLFSEQFTILYTQNKNVDIQRLLYSWVGKTLGIVASIKIYTYDINKIQNIILEIS